MTQRVQRKIKYKFMDKKDVLLVREKSDSYRLSGMFDVLIIDPILWNDMEVRTCLAPGLREGAEVILL